jgi:hypothetical protein
MARKRANKIKMLQRPDGSRCDDASELKSMVQHFYGDLFTSEPTFSTQTVLDDIPRKVSNEMNANLTKEYTNEEIKTSLFQMGPTKAPGSRWFSGALLPNPLGFITGGNLPSG